MTAHTPGGKDSTGQESILMRWFHELCSWRPTPAGPAQDAPTDWYAGLPLDPSQFSNQLCQLQKSLRPREPAQPEPVPKKPVESIAIEFGSESAA
jgi:hypothetical protein